MTNLTKKILSSDDLILDVGCGNRKAEGATGIDINPESQADIIHDLNVYPYPIPDNQFELILCMDVLEHVDDIVKTMEELYRIAKPDAIIEISVPSFNSAALHIDPTHRHGFTSRSFDFFTDGPVASKYNYTFARFNIDQVSYAKGGNSPNLIDRILLKIINRFKIKYESRFAYLYQADSLIFRLSVKK